MNDEILTKAANELTEAQLNGVDTLLGYMLAGRATFTLRSTRTGTRYTYKISVNKENPKSFFVKVLVGSDNENSYAYIGMISNKQFSLTKASKMSFDSLPVAAIRWLFNDKLSKGIEPPAGLEVWHAGRCGKCGIKLTVPESIQRGLGPKCAAVGF